VVPGIVPVELVLARTSQRAIGLTGIRAYPTGFGCTLHLRLREVIPGEQSTFGAFNMFGDGVDPAGEFADYYLRFGVGFADGRKALNLRKAVLYGCSGSIAAVQVATDATIGVPGYWKQLSRKPFRIRF
jgi:hypothetical protein